MPRHKVTFEFEATTGAASTAGSKSGWSETFYDPSDTDDATCNNKANALAFDRRKLLTPGWSLNSVRISRLDAAANLLRQGRLVFYSPADAPGKFPGGEGEEQPYDALEISLFSVNGRRRAFAMRGIATSVVSAGARFLNPAAFASRFPDFIGELTGAAGDFAGVGWAIRYRTRVNPPGVFQGAHIIRGVEIEPVAGRVGSPFSPFVAVDTYVDESLYPAGATLVIKGVQGMQRINASWKVRLATGPPNMGFYLAPKRRIQVSGDYFNGGQVTGFTYALDNIANGTPAFGTSRRTGRPLQLSRGRRSNRAE